VELKTKAEIIHKPLIRFNGHTSAWEQRKLSTFPEETYGGGTPKTSNESFWGGELPWIQSSDLTEHEVFGVEPKKRIAQSGLKNSATKLVPENSIAIITRVGVGKLAFMPFKYATSQDFLSLSKLKVDGGFAVYSLYKKLQSESHAVQGTSIKGITKDELLSKTVMVPHSIGEQSQIGEMFRTLDRLATLHQREYDKTVNIKKAMTQKMFPKDGADKPEIRLSGFAGAWEQRKLGELTQSLEYGLNAAATEFDGDNKYLRITDIDDETHEFKTDALTSPDVDLTAAENYRLKDGDVLFARTGASVGKTYRYKNFDGLVYFAGFLIRARIKPEYDSEFVFQNTLTDKYNRFIAITSQRSGQPGVNAQEYADFMIGVPSMTEQKKIGAFFSALDRLVTLHRRELVKLQNMKKALLEKMFV
jgi:type I restriction enzyme S subunit